MLAFLAVTMGLPLFFLLMGSFNLAPPGKPAVYGFDNWARAFSDPGTLSALWMSFLLSMVRLIPAMFFSVLFAWLIARTDMPCGKANRVLAVGSLISFPIFPSLSPGFSCWIPISDF